jgi:hypothetical protein
MVAFTLWGFLGVNKMFKDRNKAELAEWARRLTHAISTPDIKVFMIKREELKQLLELLDNITGDDYVVVSDDELEKEYIKRSEMGYL